MKKIIIILLIISIGIGTCTMSVLSKGIKSIEIIQKRNNQMVQLGKG